MPVTIYPLHALRTVVLHQQHLTAPHSTSLALTSDALVDLVKDLGYIQIDTLQVVNRAHYVNLWSRFGPYDLEKLDGLLYRDGQRRLFEGWGHAASIMPFDHWRYHRWRVDSTISYNPGFSQWKAKPENQTLLSRTLDRIQEEEGLRVRDFETKVHRQSEWYDWRPAKMALEVLFAAGDLMVADRPGFQRVYDLRERVLPDWVNTDAIDPDQGRLFCLDLAAKSLGVFEARNLTFYAYMRAKPAQHLVKQLIETGVVVEVSGESTDKNKKWLVHHDTLPLLQQAADGAIKAERTTFLSAFDSLFWAQDRDEKLWGFAQLLECYKSAEQRRYGYLTFPILHKDRLVGRFDPKLERETGTMRLNAIYLEPGIAPDEELVADIAQSMRDFLVWHRAENFEIIKSEPSDLREKLLAAIERH